MAKLMLIDVAHPEESRVAVIQNNKLQEFDLEIRSKSNIKSNIYLAKVIRVEPSLQATFVEFAKDRYGFLPFSEIHPDYYRIPVADRHLEEETEEVVVESETEEVIAPDVEILGGEDAEEFSRVPSSRKYKHYKIQEVIRRRQIMLVQVMKEERQSKRAALTTYLSLAGRYCVLMPNAGKGGGISRKITDTKDRKRLKTIIEGLNVPEGMGMIIRTAGMDRTKAEITRDFDYLLELWDEIRELTLKSIAPTLIHAEGALITRTLRDLYTKDIDKIIVEGEAGYEKARNFIRKLIPSHVKKIEMCPPNQGGIFQKYNIEDQIEAISSPIVALPSGGYLIINPTEALISIDVNSGRATRERHIEETALKTNLEAAEACAQQLRIRNLAGLVVIDFIDMEEQRNIIAVEKRLKEAMSSDKARLQIGRISAFGLLELTRQRLRPSVLENSTHACTHCQGTGVLRSVESLGIQALRFLEKEIAANLGKNLTVEMPHATALYLMNTKKKNLLDLEENYHIVLKIIPNSAIEKDMHITWDAIITEDNDPALKELEEKEDEKEIIRSIADQKQNKKNFIRITDKSNPEAIPALADDTFTEGSAIDSSEVDVVSAEKGTQNRRRRRRKRRKERVDFTEQLSSENPDSVESSSSENSSAEVLEQMSLDTPIPETNINGAGGEQTEPLEKNKSGKEFYKKRSASRFKKRFIVKEKNALKHSSEDRETEQSSEFQNKPLKEKNPMYSDRQISDVAPNVPQESDEKRKGWWQRLLK